MNRTQLPSYKKKKYFTSLHPEFRVPNTTSEESSQKFMYASSFSQCFNPTRSSNKLEVHYVCKLGTGVW